MFDHLPTELRLKTFAYLEVGDLCNVQLVCRSWRQFFLSNESSIYRHAAALLGFVCLPEITLAEAKAASPPGSMERVEDWKAFVKRRFKIERNWQGRSQPKVKEFWSPGTTVHRIKIDEQAGYIITTSGSGGITVTDLYKDEVLWSLPQDYVREYAHCEYGGGYMIFDRFGGFKEVWRRANDFENATLPMESLPDAWQLQASASAAMIHRSSAPRGHFRPWALIVTPEIGRAFRFVCPTLLVAAENQAFLWDITTGRRTMTINDTQMPVGGTSLGIINYVEVNEQYVVICGTKQLRIFDRPQGALVYHIQASQPNLANLALDLTQYPDNREVLLVPLATSARPNDNSVEAGQMEWGIDSFVAAHISPCGSILVVLLTFGKAIIVGNLQRVVNGEIALADAALEINMQRSLFRIPWSTYLALGDGRVSCATRGGIYVITLDSCMHGATVENDHVASQGAQLTQHPPFPHIAVCKAICFDIPVALGLLSCLQMTDTSIFITFMPMPSLHHSYQSSSDMHQHYLTTMASSGHNNDNGDVVDCSQLVPSEHQDGGIGFFGSFAVPDLQANEEEWGISNMAGPSTQPAFEEEQNIGPAELQDIYGSPDESDDDLSDWENKTIVVAMNFIPE